MTMLKWITKDTNINFMKARYFTYILSSILVILSIASIYLKSFNFGIDFSGGILMEIKSEQPINIEEIRSKLSVIKLDELNLQTIGTEGKELMIRAQADNADEVAQRKAVAEIREIFPPGSGPSGCRRRCCGFETGGRCHPCCPDGRWWSEDCNHGGW